MTVTFVQPSPPGPIEIKAGIFRKYDHHFLLDEAKLRKIAEALRSALQKLESGTYAITYFAELKNDSYFETESLDDVVQYDNPLGKEIETLFIHIHEKEEEDKSVRNSTLTVRFSATQEPKILFSIKGQDRDWCFLLAEELDTQVRRTQTHPRHFLLDNKRVDLLGIAGVLLLIGLILAIYFPTRQTPTLPTIDSKLDWLISLHTGPAASLAAVALGLTMLAMVVVTEVKPLRRLLTKFRRSTFYWGDAKARHDDFYESVGRWKWGGVIAFGISVVSGLLIWWLQVRAAS